MKKAQWVFETSDDHNTEVLGYRTWQRWKPYPHEMLFVQALYGLLMYRDIIGTLPPMRITNLLTREHYEDFPRTIRY